MPNIMINCPFFEKPVPTGLTTEAIVFASLIPDMDIPLECPACKKMHKWKPSDAWVDTSRQTPQK